MSTPSSCQDRAFSVAVSSASGGTPSGQVELLSDQTVLSTAVLRNGEAILSAASLPAGAYSFVARYKGDAHHRSAVSPAMGEYISPEPGCGTRKPLLPDRGVRP